MSKDELEVAFNEAMKDHAKDIVVSLLHKQIPKSATLAELLVVLKHPLVKDHLEDIKVGQIFNFGSSTGHSTSSASSGGTRVRGANVSEEDNKAQQEALIGAMKAAGKGSRADVIAKIRVNDPTMAEAVEKRWNILTTALKADGKINKEGEKLGTKWFVVAQGQTKAEAPKVNRAH